MRCLLIDDNPIDLLVNERVIANVDAAHEIVKQQSATDALEYLQTCEMWPDIILLDINMPVMNGFDFLEAYRKIETIPHRDIAIYILSSSLDSDDVRRANADEHVTDYLQKPLKQEDVEGIVVCGQ